MKNAPALKSLATMALMLFSIAFANAQDKKTGKAVIKTTLYCDHCKACETCGKNLQSNMLKISGVRMYELDEKAMTITVYYNTKKTNPDTIRKRIAALGFDADEIKAEAEAYEKLDNCCKMR